MGTWPLPLFATEDLGIYLGTSTTWVCSKSKGLVALEPTLVAVRKTTNRIEAVGNAARLLAGRDAWVEAVSPIKDDVVEDSEVAESLIRHFYQKALGRRFWLRPRVVFPIPGYSTYVERRALMEAAVRAGASRVLLVSSALTAALGAGAPITQSKGTMIVHIGRSGTEIAIFSNATEVTARSLRIGTSDMDLAIMLILKRRYGFQIASATAERIRSEIGTAGPIEENAKIEVNGRPLYEGGIPRSFVVSSKDVHDALEGPLSLIIEGIRLILARVPVEFAGDIVETGIYLSGDGALLRDMERRLQEEVDLSVSVAVDPPAALVLGTMKYLSLWNIDTAEPSIYALGGLYAGTEQELTASQVLATVPHQSRFHSCFLSYSHADGNFAEQLYGDLQEAGVTCFFAPKNLPIGARTRPALDENVRQYDKLLLILSANSVRSQWVEQEVETALAREGAQNNQIVLFPVRIDDAVFNHRGGWPELIKNTRNIGDFTNWRDPKLYRLSLERLLDNLHSASS